MNRFAKMKKERIYTLFETLSMKKERIYTLFETLSFLKHYPIFTCKWALFSQKLAGIKEKSLVNPMIYKTLAFFCRLLAFVPWALRDSNPRPSGCKPDALNQLS